jgi:hypothetical protein
MDNLIAIENCKEDIKTALINKGVDMTGVAFTGYAEKINALQLESGDTPTPPTLSVDYIYSNGYPTGGTEKNEIINFIPYEIVLDGDGKFVINLTCPEEIPGYEGGTYYDVIFTVEIPTTYNITNFELYAEGMSQFVPQAYKANPRHTTVVREGVTYNSYVRSSSDGLDIGSSDVQYNPLQYKITIEKK